MYFLNPWGAKELIGAFLIIRFSKKLTEAAVITAPRFFVAYMVYIRKMLGV